MMEIPEPTSERLHEEHRHASPELYLLYLIHVVTYDYVRELVAGRTVLDLGCGSGYGAARLAEHCREIVGIDIDPETIGYAEQRYRRGNLAFRTVPPIEKQGLPFANASFDIVLSFQVIEHIRDVERYLEEIRRVLRPGGTLVVSTPDRSSRLLPLQKPWNRWHLREYSAEGLRAVLAQHFGDVAVKMMGGRPDVVALEARRTRLLRWAMLPFTLPFVPEPLRVWGLGMVRATPPTPPA